MDKLLRAIAVDDEQHSLDTLLWELNRKCPEVEIVNTYTDAREAYEGLRNADIDILFLDIHLKSTSGIDLLQSLQPVDFSVIFVTAYDEYAIRAFDLSASHYLLKPVNGKKLQLAVARIRENKLKTSRENITKMIATLKRAFLSVQRIPFPVQSGVEFVDPKDIIYIKGDDNYSIIHLSDQQKLVVSKTLSHVEKKLQEFSFLRIHKSYIINLRYIVRYVKYGGCYVEMQNGQKLNVSRMNRTLLNDLFK